MYMYASLLIIYYQQGWDKVAFKASSAKTNKYMYWKVRTCFYQCCSYLDWLQNASKTGLLLYNKYQSCSCCCFYLDLVLLDCELRQKQPTTQPRLFWNMAKLLTTCLNCTSANIKVGMAAKLRWEKFSFNCTANE